MKTLYDAVVLGAGIAGLSVARELAKLKRRVLVLEREEMGGKTSRAAAGILDPYTEAVEETPFYQLGLKALDYYPSFLDEIQELSSVDVEYQKLGILYAALSLEDEDILKSRFEWQKSRGLPVEYCSAGEARKREPFLSKKTRSGIFYPEIAKLNASKLVDALLKATRLGGVEIRQAAGNYSIRIKGGKIQGIEGPQGLIETPVVVLAAGAWAGLERELELDLKVRPVRGQILILRADTDFYPKHILHTLRWAYMIPWPNRKLLVGSTLESAGFDARVTPEGKKDILERASELVEGITKLPLETSWAGLRPYSEGGPMAGPTRIEGLYLATGYYRSGILISPFVGKLLADEIAGGESSPLLEFFCAK